jgi:hypothetical protein
MTIVHDGDTSVNRLYSWRDARGLVHLGTARPEPRFSEHSTLCGKPIGALTYAGREDVGAAPNCLQCVLTR